MIGIVKEYFKKIGKIINVLQHEVNMSEFSFNSGKREPEMFQNQFKGKAKMYVPELGLTSMYAGSVPAGEMRGCQSLGGFERYLESVTTHLSRGQPKPNPK